MVLPKKQLEVSRMHCLGWRPRISLAEGLLDAYDDFLKGDDADAASLVEIISIKIGIALIRSDSIV